MDIKDVKTMAFDMDGTLLDNNKQIPPKTKEALIKLQNEGVQLILASGRPVSGLIGFAKELELEKHHGIIVTNNGAVGYDVKNNKYIYETPIELSLIKEILTDVINDGIEPMIENGKYMLVNNVFNGFVDMSLFGGQHNTNIVEYESRGGGFLLKEVRPYAESIDFNVNKILTIVDPSVISETIERYREKFGDKVHVVQTSPFFMEFTMPGVNKEYGLARLGIDSETLMSFGDNMNDKEMMQYGKYSVAMGNAVDPVKEIATYVSTSNDEEGIYEAFKHFGFVE